MAVLEKDVESFLIFLFVVSDNLQRNEETAWAAYQLEFFQQKKRDDGYKS